SSQSSFLLRPLHYFLKLRCLTHYWQRGSRTIVLANVELPLPADITTLADDYQQLVGVQTALKGLLYWYEQYKRQLEIEDKDVRRTGLPLNIAECGWHRDALLSHADTLFCSFRGGDA